MDVAVITGAVSNTAPKLRREPLMNHKMKTIALLTSTAILAAGIVQAQASKPYRRARPKPARQATDSQGLTFGDITLRGFSEMKFVPGRNMSYSLNSHITDDDYHDNVTNKDIYQGIRISRVKRAAQKIMIFEELAPNDAWCLTPYNNSDDVPSGRHGKRKTATVVNGTIEKDGQGNQCFFDGHVEGISPNSILTDHTLYEPLTVSEN